MIESEQMHRELNAMLAGFKRTYSGSDACGACVSSFSTTVLCVCVCVCVCVTECVWIQGVCVLVWTTPA